MLTKPHAYVSTTNACKLCRPLGAALAFKGIEGAVAFLHGSQGCATYMRRYIISHFREPVDIASSSLGEKEAVYGGGPNLKKGILNVMKKYRPAVVGVATTCLTETIGDDADRLVREFKAEFADLDLPEVVSVSTPAFGGSHMEGFHAAIRAVTEQVVTEPEPTTAVNLFPGFVSPEDLRHLKEICEDFKLAVTILPDYSDTLDGPTLEDYREIPEGGTPLPAIRRMAGAPASIEFGRTLRPERSAGGLLQTRHGVRLFSLGLPIGLRETDALFTALEEITGRPTPRRHALERGRLLDAYVDGHKYLSGKRAVIYGEEDLVAGLTAFLSEIGVKPVLAASGGSSGRLSHSIASVCGSIPGEAPEVLEDVDFHDIVEHARGLAPDLVIGNSKGYRVLARELGIPLIRVGFPVHDRFGAQRLRHLGYRGALALFDAVVNAVLEKSQDDSAVGYGYL
ncbi:MAG: nitrogenase [Deltaproteobacteria bacterium]|nr:nitrogenase [Deltaproteobacteria bacterium]